MPDHSYFDLKYFIDPYVYNCPFCNRKNVQFSYSPTIGFDWSNTKKCAIWRVNCSSCQKNSMHLTFVNLQDKVHGPARFRKGIDIDAAIFYSVPSSFFTVDSRIPKVIRELISEAEGCLKMNYLTGASACTRKAIYELLVWEKVKGAHYDDRIKALKSSHPEIDPELFDILAQIKDMTSDKIHEQSWDKWESGHLKLFLETLKTILHEMFVVPKEREQRKKSIRDIEKSLSGDRKKDENEQDAG